MTTTAAGGMAVLGFFARSYFAATAKDLAKIEGQLDSLQKDIRANTTELAIATTELKAIWRYIDGANERASDTYNGSK